MRLSLGSPVDDAAPPTARTPYVGSLALGLARPCRTDNAEPGLVPLIQGAWQQPQPRAV